MAFTNAWANFWAGKRIWKFGTPHWICRNTASALSLIHIFVTDVCLKRKIRDYVETVKEDAPGYRIYIKSGVPLNRSDAEAYAYLGLDGKSVKERKKDDPTLDIQVRDFMCENFYDIRTFGAVMTLSLIHI